jgi:hypothetical protein
MIYKIFLENVSWIWKAFRTALSLYMTQTPMRYTLTSPHLHNLREIFAFLLDRILDSQTNRRLPLIQLAHLIKQE